MSVRFTELEKESLLVQSEIDLKKEKRYAQLIIYTIEIIETII